MLNYTRIVLPAAAAVTLFLGPDLVHLRSAGAAPPPTPQDVNIVSPLTTNGSVPVEATVRGVVRTRANPALTHVGVLASDVVTFNVDYLLRPNEIREVHSDTSVTVSFGSISVPAGKALVITDVQWSGSGGTPGEVNSFQIFVYPASSPVGEEVFRMSDTYDGNGVLTRTPNMTTGITAGPGVRIAFSMLTPTTAFIHGYYVDAP
jgi:hypothetical protein